MNLSAHPRVRQRIEQLRLNLAIAGFGCWFFRPAVMPIPPAHSCDRVFADRKPDLGLYAALERVGRLGSAHARRDPPWIHGACDNIGPQAGYRAGEGGSLQLALTICACAVPIAASPIEVAH